MFFVGGMAFYQIGCINEYLEWEIPIQNQMLMGALIITCLEFYAGLIVNVLLGWNVWDYSKLPLNVMGQICLPFCLIWYFLSGVAIVLDDYIRYWLFKEEQPHYCLKRSKIDE